jgi:hypothetical protein
MPTSMGGFVRTGADVHVPHGHARIIQHGCRCRLLIGDDDFQNAVELRTLLDLNRRSAVARTEHQQSENETQVCSSR